MSMGLIALAVCRQPVARAPTSATEAAAYTAPHRLIRMGCSLAPEEERGRVTRRRLAQVWRHIPFTLTRAFFAIAPWQHVPAALGSSC